MKKTTSRISISIIAALAFTPFTVFAQNSAPIQPAVPAAAPIVTSTPGTIREQCQKVTEKIDLKISNYTEAHSNFDTRAAAMIDRLRSVSSKLSSKGIDVSILENSIISLETKRIKLAASKQAFISKLQESKQFTCGASQGQFKSKVNEAKTLQKTVVTDSKDVQAAAKSVREIVKNLRNTVASSTQLVQ